MTATRIVRLLCSLCGATLSATLAVYYESSLADAVASFVGYQFAVFVVPMVSGLLLGAVIAAVLSKLQSEPLVRLWYMPATLCAASVAPVLIVTILMNLGPT